MLSEHQARKVCREMQSELNARPASVVACLAGIAIIVVLAAATPQIRPGSDASGSTPEAKHEAPASEPAALNQASPADAAGAAMEVQARVVNESMDRVTVTDSGVERRP